tara:strand:- start:1463 stop:3493 length:2031 start_codon:yes stop_codon:yes gene_type:complete
MVIKRKVILIFLIISFFSFSQNQSNDSIQLKEVIVSITKLKDSLINTPFSISSKNYSNFQNYTQQFNLSEYIENIPGVFISNDHNYAQDSRISIRGFGSRANFGIRGIKLIVDGVPETTPDGQTQIDNLNLEIINKIEVIRGIGSSLYGNSSAGIIKIQTIGEINNNFAKISYASGSNQKNKKQVFFGLKNKKSSYSFLLSQTKSQGYRERSAFKNNNLNINLVSKIDKSSKLRFNFNYVNSPYAIDSGGLTIQEVNENRKQARERNIIYDTQESIDHYKLSFNYEKEINNKLSLSNYFFYSNRDFDGKIPVKNGGAIKLDRKYWGLGSNISFNNKIKTQIGFDLGNQNDNRKRYFNNEGEIGQLVLSQKEKFLNYGIYLVSSYNFNNITIHSGLRYDNNRISLNDSYLNDGNNSDRIDLKSTNPSLGINYKPNSLIRFFANISSGFETPTLNEYGSSPIGSGFNKSLKSQKSTNYEFGFSKRSLNNDLKIDIVYYNTFTKDEVLPYEDSQFPNQVFYNNAGKTKRKGLEFSGYYDFNNFFRINSSISVGEYLFDEFKKNEEDYSGNNIPGIPNNIFIFDVRYKGSSNLIVNLGLKKIGEMYANNSNSVKIDNYNLLNLKISQEILFKKIMLKPFLTFNNLLSINYYDNIRINAFGGRYYEPAPKTTIFGGIKIDF